MNTKLFGIVSVSVGFCRENFQGFRLGSLLNPELNVSS